MTEITIVDYGAGNLASLSNALEFLDIPAEITGDREKITHSKRLILPGVGAFAPAMVGLRANHLDEVILERVELGIPLLGICLGMQLLFTTSHEQGTWQGLNLIPGEVIQLQGLKKIPHMGWNRITSVRQDVVTESLDEEPYVYFVHSYKCQPDSPGDVVAECDYGGWFAAIIQRENVWGMQFHPEKSQQVGLHLLKNFCENT